MIETKEYSRPYMIAEHFVPQEFIAACWGLHLMCIGQAPPIYEQTEGDESPTLEYL